MRIIKFRVWDKLSKAMRYGAENNLVVVLDNPDFEVMQFTGLLDKFGKEIYEGDIVLGGDTKTKAEVYWRNGGFGIKNEFTEENPDSITFIDLESCEVIGNIYQDGHLLKTNKL